MKPFAIVAVGLSMSIALAAGLAHAKDKKPVVCIAYTESTALIEGKSEKVAICSDNKKPFILHGYSFISMTDDSGSTVKAIVGWR